MPKFDKKYVLFMWDDELEGKRVFFADYISLLQIKVEKNDREYYGEVIQGDPDLPFRMTDNRSRWTFIYYDPYYELKLAREQGKVIQRYWKSEQEWKEHIGDDFYDDISIYRVKPDEPEEKPVTHMELARWLVQGNGQIYHYDDSGFRTEVKTYYGYHQELDNCDCNEYKTFRSKIRKWGDTEWHEPTREYMGLD